MESTPPSAGEPFDDALRTSWERLGGIFTEVAGKLDAIQAENRALVDRVEELDRTVRGLRRELARVQGELEEARRPAHTLPLESWLGEVERTARTRLEEDAGLGSATRSQLDALRAIARVGRGDPEGPDEAEDPVGVRAGRLPGEADEGGVEERSERPGAAEPSRVEARTGNGVATGEPRPPLPERGSPTSEEDGDAGLGPGTGPETDEGSEPRERPIRRSRTDRGPAAADESAPPPAPSDGRPSGGAPAASIPLPRTPRPRRPLYEPTLWDERFGWLDDAIAKLDPEPLVRRLQPRTDRVSRWLGSVVVPAAELQERLSRGASATHRRVREAVGSAIRALPVPPAVREALWLDPPRAAESDPEGAHGVLKRRYGAVFWSAVILSVGLHTILFVFWPDFRADDVAVSSGEIRTVEMPPEVEVPPPPQQIARPAVPVVGAAAVADDITIAPTTFEENPVENLPPPPEAGGGSAGPGEPSFTPFTVAPSIRNRDELVRIIRDSYPPALRDAGIGGEVVVWFYIDESGAVQDTRVARSSGYEALDAAALRVADRFRFTPALNRDNAVAVWVQFPITFVSR